MGQIPDGKLTAIYNMAGYAQYVRTYEVGTYLGICIRRYTFLGMCMYLDNCYVCARFRSVVNAMFTYK
jgi:hypothetical protein